MTSLADMPTATPGYQRTARIVYALGMMSVGLLALVYGQSALAFEPLPAWVPLPDGLGRIAGIIMLGSGAGLLSERTVRPAIRILFPLLLIWLLARLRVPISDPLREISWFVVGVVAVLAVAALVLLARHGGLHDGSQLALVTRPNTMRVAFTLFGLSLVTFGLSHFFEFAERTISLVPAWLPFRKEWAWLAGGGQVAAGLGVAFRVYPRLAATAQAAMMSLFAIVIWVPAVLTDSTLQSNWVEFLVTAALAGACWVVAESIPVGRAEPTG